MRRIFILAIISLLIFPTLVHAKNYGPLWAVWTHSEDPRECMAKTTFWMLIISGAVYYVAKKLTDNENALCIAPSAERKWRLIIWIEADSEEEYSAVGIKILW